VALDVLEEQVGLREMAQAQHIMRSHPPVDPEVRNGQLTDELDEVRIAEYAGKIAELERKVGQLTMEVDLLEKWTAADAGPTTTVSPAIQERRPKGFSVARGCRTMKLARSTYYTAHGPRRGGQKRYESALSPSAMNCHAMAIDG
jgi:hypothetical protein